MAYKKENPAHYVCETCRHTSYLSSGGKLYEVKCKKCGGVAYRDPFPADEMMRRLDALIDRLTKEDGPISV